MKTKLIIADDHDIYRDGLKSLLADIEGLEICAECRDGDQLMDAIAQHRPEIVISDFKMPGMPVLELIRRSRKTYLETKFLMLTVANEELMVVDALEAGASGFIIKDPPRSELPKAIHYIRENQPYYCASTIQTLVSMLGSRLHLHRREARAKFNEPELTIIQLTCADKSVKEMALALNMSVRTIEKYRSSIFGKMGVKTVAGVAVYAIKHKLFSIDDDERWR